MAAVCLCSLASWVGVGCCNNVLPYYYCHWWKLLVSWLGVAAGCKQPPITSYRLPMTPELVPVLPVPQQQSHSLVTGLQSSKRDAPDATDRQGQLLLPQASTQATPCMTIAAASRLSSCRHGLVGLQIGAVDPAPHTCKCCCSPAAAAEGAQTPIEAAGLADAGSLLRGGPGCRAEQLQDPLATSHCVWFKRVRAFCRKSGPVNQTGMMMQISGRAF